jgi:hypothetical protein
LKDEWGWRTGLPQAESNRWEISKKDVERAVKMSKHSAPGPDGIPYKVWKELGDFGVTILWAAMAELQKPEAIETLKEAYGGMHEFNAGVMVCLPKSATERAEDGDEVYEATNTRPLAIGNTDNRILCSAARLRYVAMGGHL